LTIVREVSRRGFLKTLGAGGTLGLVGNWGALGAFAQQPAAPHHVPDFTRPGTDRYWNSVGPLVTEPQKSPLILF
jgi:sulfite oxidase